MNEIDLMKMVAEGNAPAIQVLLDSHYEAVYRLLRHLTRRREDAEDLTQDVFLAARTKGASFSGNGSIRSWLTRIAINAYGKHRRRERLRRICRIEGMKSRSEVDSMLDSEWLLDGIAKLNPQHRIALLLHEVHGFSVGEVATITGSPEGTVKARLHYARKRIQQILICPDGEK